MWVEWGRQERTIIQSGDGSRKDRLKKGEEFSVDEPFWL